MGRGGTGVRPSHADGPFGAFPGHISAWPGPQFSQPRQIFTARQGNVYFLSLLVQNNNSRSFSLSLPVSTSVSRPLPGYAFGFSQNSSNYHTSLYYALLLIVQDEHALGLIWDRKVPERKPCLRWWLGNNGPKLHPQCLSHCCEALVMDEWMGGWVFRQMDGKMDGWMNRLMVAVGKFYKSW